LRPWIPLASALQALRRFLTQSAYPLGVIGTQLLNKRLPASLVERRSRLRAIRATYSQRFASFAKARIMGAANAGLLILFLITATMLAGCGTSFNQCDATNVPSANCYQQQGPPYRN
jgi:hypothetical protein